MRIIRNTNSDRYYEWQIIKAKGNFGRYKVIKGSDKIPEGYEFYEGRDVKSAADEFVKRANDSIRL